MLNGKKNGLTEFYTYGQLTSKINYKNDIMHGLAETFYEDGKVESKENYNMGVLDGKLIKYYYSGKVEVDAFVVNGKPTTDSKSYFKSGRKKSEFIKIDNGKKIKELTYFENGKINSELFYDSKFNKNGLSVTYDLNNNIIYKGSYKNDLMEGSSITYFSDGKVKTNSNYIQGKQNGLYEKYEQPKQDIYCLIIEGKYVDGLKEGIFRHYNKLGEIEDEIHYKNDYKILTIKNGIKEVVYFEKTNSVAHFLGYKLWENDTLKIKVDYTRLEDKAIGEKIYFKGKLIRKFMY